MMGLAETQRRFFAHVTGAEEEGAALSLPPEWDARMRAGLEVYRNAYRARLIAALRVSYERVWTWVGDEAFDAAAAHHLILHPPASWTLDDAGRGFDVTLVELFPQDPEVAELAWLEWAMQSAFTAADSDALDAAAFGARTARFDEDDWAALRLGFAPSLVSCPIRTACAQIWHAIAEEGDAPDPVLLDQPAVLVVWREGLTPRFRVLDTEEATALGIMTNGGTLSDVCESLADTLGDEQAAAQAGAMLGRWISDGLVRTVS